MSLTLFLLITSSLIASLFFKEKWLWMDEVLSYTLLSDPSWQHMNNAIVSCLDANPPVFFNLYWPIAHWVSMDPIVLKTVSILLFAVAVVVFFRYATELISRPTSNFVILTLGIGFTYLNYTLSTQIRTYSWYVLLCCLFFIAMHRLALNPQSRANLLVHLLIGVTLVLTHNFGLFYTASSLGLFGILLLWSRRNVYWLPILTHLLIFGAWLVIWYANFQIQSQVGKPYSWIPVPTFGSFFRVVGELIPALSSRLEQSSLLFFLPILRVGLFAGVFFYLALPIIKRGFTGVMASKKDSFFLLAGYLVVSTIGIALIVSLVYKSIFLSRYLWSDSLLFLFLIMYLADGLLARSHYSGWATVSRFVPVYAVGILVFMFYQSQKISMFPSKILSYLPKLEKGYPVFFESADYFLPVWHHNLANAFFLLDRQTATRADNLRNASNDYNVIGSLRNKYHVETVIPVDQFSTKLFKEFYVVDESSRIQIEQLIKDGRVKVLETIPVAIDGHRIVKCAFTR